MRRQRPDGSLAQLGEHLPYKQRVTGSSPVTSTNMKPSKLCGLEGFCLFIATFYALYSVNG